MLTCLRCNAKKRNGKPKKMSRLQRKPHKNRRCNDKGRQSIAVLIEEALISRNVERPVG